MATNSVPSSVIARAIVGVRKEMIGASSSSILGVPQIVTRGDRMRCSSANKSHRRNELRANTGMAASLLPVAGAMSRSNPALALVDERMSTEGTGLTLGISNNVLGWILVGVFGVIWSLYFVYTSTLDEDEDSGLSL